VSFWFHRHNIVLPSVIMLYFCPSQYRTSLRYHVVCSIITHLFTKLQRVVYYPKLSIHTFCSYCCVLLVITMLYFLLWNIFIYIFTRDRVYSLRLDIYTSHSYWCVLPFSSWQSLFMQIIKDRVYFPKAIYVFLDLTSMYFAAS
jgi:hypothetical protein